MRAARRSVELDLDGRMDRSSTSSTYVRTQRQVQHPERNKSKKRALSGFLLLLDRAHKLISFKGTFSFILK
jgi:hypothetical protein